MFEILFHNRARKNYERLPQKAALLIDRALAALELQPLSGPQIKKLHGELAGCYRLRVGEYRIVYHIDQPQRLVIIDAIGSRGNIY